MSSTDATEPMKALTITDVMRLTGFSKPKVYREINAGRLVARKCGCRTIVLTRDFERFLEEMPVIGRAAQLMSGEPADA